MPPFWLSLSNSVRGYCKWLVYVASLLAPQPHLLLFFALIGLDISRTLPRCHLQTYIEEPAVSCKKTPTPWLLSLEKNNSLWYTYHNVSIGHALGEFLFLRTSTQTNLLRKGVVKESEGWNFWSFISVWNPSRIANMNSLHIFMLTFLSRLQ